MLAGAVCALLGASQPLAAVNTKFWRMASQPSFARGHLRRLSLGPEGTLALAPALIPVLATGQPLIWAAAAGHNGDIYVATGNNGQLYRLTAAMARAAERSGQPVAARQALFFTAPEPEIFAVAAGSDGAVYAATSPNGKIYRITPDGRSTVYFDPHTRYIWSLCFLGRTLYAGTGEQGIIYRILPASGGQGAGKAFFRTGERQVTVLATGPDGSLLAGTDPGGLIFRIATAQGLAGRGRVLYDSPLREISALFTAKDGAVYATAQGGARGAPEAIEAQAEQMETPDDAGAMTVVAESRQQQPAQSPGGLPGGGNGEVTVTMGPGRIVPPDSGPETVPEPNHGLRSAIYRIGPNGGVDTQWRSKTENAGPIWPAGEGGAEPWFGTDPRGRIYRLGPDQQATLIAQSGQQTITRIFSADGALWAAASNTGTLYRLSPGPAAEGSFLSPIHDAGAVAQWGHLRWRTAAASPAAAETGNLVFYTRSGDSARPNATWSQWSAPLTQPGQQITSPPGRFIQWKAVFRRAASGSGPRLESVTLPYLPANRAPALTDLRAETAATESTLAPAADGQKHLQGIKLLWQANDPDGDPLTYRVWFQIQGESGWTALAKDLHATQLEIAPGRLPDGTYRFKVQASDADANPPARAKTAVAISGPAIMDTQPPTVLVASARAAGGTAVVRFSARDRVAALSRAAYAVDGGAWRQMLSDSGIIDSRQESFTVRAQHLTPGQHVIMLRVYDRGGNRGTAAAVVTVR